VVELSLKVVIIGSVATGPKTGCRVKRLMPEASVIMLDRDELISYGGCGIPFYVSGDVSELKALMSTSFHMVRDVDFFRGAKGIEVRPGHEALAIDRKAKTLRVRDLKAGWEYDLDYDFLVIATGSKPFIPPIPGAELDGVMPVANLHHAERIKNLVSQGQVGSAAIIGAGATGLEMAEAMADLWGVEVHIFEMAPQILPGALDGEIAHMLASHLEEQEGVNLHLGSRVEAILADDEGRARAVKADGVEYEVDLVIMATGVKPNAELAREAGLELTANGGIRVDKTMRTSDPAIYAGGDCVAMRHLLSGEDSYMPSGSLANRQGRVIGSNICGLRATFPGLLGTFCIKLFGLTAARTGLDEAQCARLGLDAVSPLLVQADRAHFHPDMKLMYLKLTAERATGKVLGCVALGESGDAVVGRINAVAGMLPFGAKLEHISNLELAYSPPLGAALDILNAAANTAENLIAGKLRPMPPEEFSRRLACKDGHTCFLDMRAIDNAAPYLESLAPHWVHLPQETLTQRLAEVPRDKDVVLICNSGVRSYEAQVMLDAAGIENTFNLSGGVAAVKRWGDPILPQDEDA
jgi:NADPH-dependent 2,4-dienoyl-CoA reductase/sulfur reductase-like enzyme/rhodanese-related sulfurtransferase